MLVSKFNMYSGTSHNGLSEIRTASIQWTNNVPPIDFAIEIIHFQPPRDGQPPISGQWTEHVPPKDTEVAVQNSLQERTEIKASGRKCEISIKILTDSYSAASRKYIRSFVL